MSRHSSYPTCARTEALGAVAGLAAASLGLVLALSHQAVLATESAVLARVNGVPISQAYVDRQLAALPPGEQIAYREDLPRFVDSVIREEVLFQYAIARLNDSPAAAFRDQAKSTLLEQLVAHEVDAKVNVSDADVAAYYRANPSQVRGEHWRIAHIPMRKREDCEALLPTLVSPGAFTAAAREHSIDPELAAKGGDMGYFMRHTNLFGLGALLRRLPLHQPFLFEDQDGCHIVQITEHLDPPLPPLAEVADRLRAFLRTRERNRLLRRLLDAAEKSVKVERPAASRP